MIGIFILDEKPSVDKQLVLGHSKINDGISGYFYFRESDCADVCSVESGSEFFGVLDDTSGFGACLFILNLELEKDNLLLQHNLHVKENADIDGDLYVGKDTTMEGNTSITGTLEVNDDTHLNRNCSILGNLDVTGKVTTKSTYTGSSPNTMINLTAAHVALILGAAMSGVPAPLPAVPVQMIN